jgi:outer membrane protein TolC
MTRPIRPPRCLWPMLAAGAIALVCGGRVARAQTTPAPPPPPPAPQTSLTLGDVVAMAKERAPSVHAAFARIASAEAGIDRVAAGRLPSLSLQGSGTAFATNGQVYSGGVVSTASNEWYLVGTGALNLSWNIYDFGHTQAAVDAAKAGVRSATLLARATEQSAMAEAAVAFFSLLADDELVRSSEAARADREHVVTITKHLVEAGYRTPVDATRAQIALDVANLDRSMAMATRDSDAVTLATALMLDPATSFRLTAPQPLAVDEAAAGNAAVALRGRRDVAAAAARVDQARLGLTSANRGRLPVFGASASGQVLYSHDSSTSTVEVPTGVGGRTQGATTSIPFTSTTDGPSELVQGSLTLTFPLFDATINANIRTAEASLGEAQASLEQVTLSARGEAIQAARQARSARGLLDQSQHLLTGTSANLAAVEDRYANGMEDPLVLADAQREDALARVAIVRARLAYDVAAVRLLAGLSRADELLKMK